MAALREKGIGSQVHYIPVHLLPYYREKYQYSMGDFRESENFYLQELSLPLYPSMTECDISTVVSGVLQCIK